MNKPSTRIEIAARKNALVAELRAMAQAAAPGNDQIVSVRALSSKYDLALRTVSLELQTLVEEGVLYTIPRVGTFVGRPQANRGDLFLAIFPYIGVPGITNSQNAQWLATQYGFEEQIATLGGTSMVLDFETACRYHQEDKLVAPAGVFEFVDYTTKAIWCDSDLPHAHFGELKSDAPNSDAVYFDNFEGGRQATRHLIDLGHERIAYLGLHNPHYDVGFFVWSQLRENGWRQALEDAGLNTRGLAFHLLEAPVLDDIPLLQKQASAAAAALIEQGEFTAVITSNRFATLGLLEKLRDEERPMNRWPAIVAFDTEISNTSHDSLYMVTALRLPWEEIGREAANSLWNRAQGRYSEPQQHLVPMKLIPRLSCRGEWHRAPGSTSRREVAATQNNIVMVA